MNVNPYSLAKAIRSAIAPHHKVCRIFSDVSRVARLRRRYKIYCNLTPAQADVVRADIEQAATARGVQCRIVYDASKWPKYQGQFPGELLVYATEPTP